MRESLSSKALALLLLITMLPVVGYSENSGVTIKNAETTLSGDNYLVNADIDYQLSDKATEALQNGVSLFWTYQFKVEERHDFMWNKTLVEKSFRYRIQYHALLNMYRVLNESNGAVDNFSSLRMALDMLSAVRNVRLIEKTKISNEETYIAGMKVTFERDALPLPLRPSAYVNPQWYLSSDWFEWPLKK